MLTQRIKIETKVRAKMRWLKIISGSPWGPRLERMRQLYLTSVRPIMTYACPAWFVIGDENSWTYGLKKYLVHRLDRLQYECLITISGAYQNTSEVVLHKELHIEPIALHLHRIAMAHRVREFDTGEAQDLEEVRKHSYPRRLTRKFVESHPYNTVYHYAKLLRADVESNLRATRPELADGIWGDKHGRQRAITSYMGQQAALKCAQMWDRYRRDHSKGTDTDPGSSPVALEDEWGPANLKRHRNLPRAQSSILIQMRTGSNGLDSFLYKKKVRL